MFQSTILPVREQPRLSPKRVSHSDPALPMRTRPIEGVDSVHGGLAERVDEDHDSSDEYDSSTPIGGEDLSQSQLFSHEDAESMYMSAISQQSLSARIPGGWNDSDSSIPGSPHSHEKQTIALDNLENARQASPSQSFTEKSTFSASQHLPAVNQPVSPRPATPTPLHQTHSLPHTSSSVSERSTASSDEYTKMIKQIFELDQISIYLPSKFSHEGEEISSNATQHSMLFSSSYDSNPSQSTSVNIPGAFSTHLPPRRSPQIPPGITHLKDSSLKTPITDDSIEIEVGQLVSHFDISVGRLVWRLVQRIKEALKQDTAAAEASKPDAASDEFNLKFSAEHISLQFLERLEGTLIPANSAPEAVPWVKAPDTAILLQASLKGISIDMHTSQASTETAIRLRKFIFGYAQESILSFDADLQMRASVRDLKASAGIDISMIIKQTKDINHVDVNTLPMHVEIDLQRLDETFSWFGGLSSVLNLGNSIASNATITTANTPKQKPRSVRFDTSPNPEILPSSLRSKIDIRIGGFILDLVGEKCSIGVETSAVKVISRDSIVAAGIQKIRLSGPHLRNSDEEPAIVVEVIGTRLDFLPSPQDADLDMLLSLITPSKVKYDQDDDILLDTLLRQRKQGSVLKLNIDDVNARIGRLDQLSYLPELGEEVSRLSTVTKYLPDDDRPGLLTLIKIRKFDAHIDIGRSVGTVQLVARETEIAQITLPALVALSVNAVTVHRNYTEQIIGAATDPKLRESGARAPAIMARLIGDEMEPIIKIKLWNLRADYRVSTLMAILDLAENVNQDNSASLTASVATLTGPRSMHPHHDTKHSLSSSKQNVPSLKPLTIDVVLRDCILGLNPLGLPSQVLVVLTEAHISAVLPQHGKASATGDMSKASILVIDNVANITSGQMSARSRRLSFDGGSSQVTDLCATGFVSVSYISSAKANIQMLTDVDGEITVEVELRDERRLYSNPYCSSESPVSALTAKQGYQVSHQSHPSC
jgi:autophagy-related protein 2